MQSDNNCWDCIQLSSQGRWIVSNSWCNWMQLCHRRVEHEQWFCIYVLMHWGVLKQWGVLMHWGGFLWMLVTWCRATFWWNASCEVNRRGRGGGIPVSRFSNSRRKHDFKNRNMTLKTVNANWAKFDPVSIGSYLPRWAAFSIEYWNWFLWIAMSGKPDDSTTVNCSFCELQHWQHQQQQQQQVQLISTEVFETICKKGSGQQHLWGSLQKRLRRATFNCKLMLVPIIDFLVAVDASIL